MSLDSTLAQMFEQYHDVPISDEEKLREILQQSALLGLARLKFFEHAAFYGGTALRILYGLNRFSEDLDFSLLKPDPNFKIAPYLKGLKEEMAALGFDCDIAQKEKTQESAVLSAFLKTNTLNLLLSISKHRKSIHPEQKLRVKLEVDTEPPLGFSTEKKLILNPIPFHVVSYKLPDLFAGKMHAVLCRGWKNRVKGRDWYDLIWFVAKKIPCNLNHLEMRMRQTEHIDQELTRDKLLELLHERIDTIDWEKAKADVLPFITDKREVELWSAPLFHAVADRLEA